MRTQRRKLAGSAAVLGIVLAAAVAGLIAAYFWRTGTTDDAVEVFEARESARAAADFGIDAAIECLNAVAGRACGGATGAAHAGETGIQLESGLSYTTSLTDAGDGRKAIISTGSVPLSDGSEASVVLSAELSTGRIAEEDEGVFEVSESEAEPILDSWKRVPGSTREPEAP